MKLKVQLQKTDEGYAANCCELLGCWFQGKTQQDAMDNIRDAIEAYLIARRGEDEGESETPVLV